MDAMLSFAGKRSLIEFTLIEAVELMVHLNFYKNDYFLEKWVYGLLREKVRNVCGFAGR